MLPPLTLGPDTVQRVREATRIIAEGVASGDFHVTDTRATALAALSLVVDVARWYHPGIKRTTPEQIGRTYGALALRLVGARTA